MSVSQIQVTILLVTAIIEVLLIMCYVSAEKIKR